MSAGAKAAGVCLALVLILLALACAVYAMAADGSLLSAEMLRRAPPQTTGLPEAEYPGVGRMTAGYLTGKLPVFQYTFSVGESTYLCFQEHEAAHMADCRGLILLAGSLRWVFGAAAGILACAGILLKRREAFAGGMLAGLRAAGVLGSVILAWALADFDSFFTAFHRVAFTNDGWLLDPRTDLLLRLMPADFFMALGLRALAAMLCAALLTDLAARMIRRRSRSGRSRNGHAIRGNFPPAGGGVEKSGNRKDPGTGDQL